jgi:hypothetical protein
MAPSKIRIKVKEDWVTVPSLEVGENVIVVRGGWIKIASLNHADWLEKELENPDECIHRLKKERKNGLPADIFCFGQIPPATQPRQAFPFELESIACLCTADFGKWWESLPQETRKNVRRSQKRGVTVSVCEMTDNLISGLVDLNNDSPVRQGKPYTHYGKDFERVKEDQASFPGRSEFIAAYLGEELVGYMKLVYRGSTASILHLLPKASHQDKRPANALIAKAVEVCNAKGVTHLVFGKFNYGNKGDNPLREFKIRNGFEEVMVPRFYVPLTIWGKFCVKTKLYRGLVGILPKKVLALAVGARTKWYSLTQDQSRCSSTPERPNRNRQMERSIPPAGSNPPIAEP